MTKVIEIDKAAREINAITQVIYDALDIYGRSDKGFGVLKETLKNKIVCNKWVKRRAIQRACDMYYVNETEMKELMECI